MVLSGAHVLDDDDEDDVESLATITRFGIAKPSTESTNLPSGSGSGCAIGTRGPRRYVLTAGCLSMLGEEERSRSSRD